MFILNLMTSKVIIGVTSWSRGFTCSRRLLATHYEVLNVKPDSSQREIRRAYLQLCKEFHPDIDKSDESLHKKFLQINEAYKILSKPESRMRYNASIAFLDENKKIRAELYKNNYDAEKFARSDPSFYVNRKAVLENDERSNNYYGIKGIKRVSNGTLFLILIVISLLSGFTQIIAIKNSLIMEERSRRNMENAKILDDVREKARLRTQEEMMLDIEKHYEENLDKIYPTK